MQLFDSWVGCLSAGDYAEYVMPHVQLILTASSTKGCRSFISAPGRPPFLKSMRQAGGDVIGIDWRIPLDEAWAMVGHDRAVQETWIRWHCLGHP